MKAFFFSPHNPYPPASGFHKRQLEILSGLKHSGCNIHLLSSEFDQYRHWNDGSIQYLKQNLVDAVHIFHPNQWDRLLYRLPKYRRVILNNFPKATSILTPPRYRAWFATLYQEHSPDLIWMNHAYSDGLINHDLCKEIIRVVDTIDLVSVNRKMWQAISSLNQPGAYISADNVKERLLAEDCFAKADFQADAWEYTIYDQYSFTVSINTLEADMIRKNTSQTEVVYIPMSVELPNIVTDHSGPAIFPTGDNPYNVQGYFYFIKKVLPMVLKDADDFRLQVTGYCSAERVSSSDGVMLSGYLPDLTSSYQTARFLVCPVFGGTGQLVKVIEAMSYGLPAVILRQAATRAPVRHKENGFIANDAKEFAEYTLRLWRDQRLCRQMGQTARDTVATDFSKLHLLEGLNQILSTGYHV